MNARSQLIRFSVIWLAIFVVCSILSAFAYSSEPPKQEDNSAEASTQKPGKAPEKKPDANKKPDSTKDPEAEPETEPDTESLYDQLIYSADNAQYLIFVDAGHGWYDNGSSVRLTWDGEYVYEKKGDDGKQLKDEKGNLLFVTESGKEIIEKNFKRIGGSSSFAGTTWDDETVYAKKDKDGNQLKDKYGNLLYVTESGKEITETNFEYVYEKDINLQLAKKVKKALEKMGYRVGEVRPGDNPEDCPVPLVNGLFYAKDRPAYVNQQGADYFVSVHCNTFNNSQVNGTRIFYSSTKPASLRLATAVLTSMQATMSGKFTLNIDNQLYILLYSTMPTVLIESGFITNHEDLTKLTDPAWQDQYACAVAKGIDADLQAQNQQ